MPASRRDNAWAGPRHLCAVGAFQFRGCVAVWRNRSSCAPRELLAGGRVEPARKPQRGVAVPGSILKTWKGVWKPGWSVPKRVKPIGLSAKNERTRSIAAAVPREEGTCRQSTLDWRNGFPRLG